MKKCNRFPLLQWVQNWLNDAGKALKEKKAVAVLSPLVVLAGLRVDSPPRAAMKKTWK